MMIFSNQAFLWFLSAAHVVFGVQLNVVDKRVEDAKNLLDQLNQKSVDVASNLVQAQWDFEKNNTDDTKKKFVGENLTAFNCHKSG